MIICVNSQCLHIAKARGIITANERVVTTNETKPLKAVVDEVMKDSEIQKLVKHVFVAKRTSLPVEICTYDVDLDKVSVKDVADKWTCVICVYDHNFISDTIGHEYSVTRIYTRGDGQ